MRSTLPEAYAVHQSPGRMRLRIPERKRDAAFFLAVGERLAGLEGIEQLRVNPMTGGVLIAHSLPPEAIFRFAEENGLFTLGSSSQPVSQPTAGSGPRRSLTAIGRLFTHYDRKFRRLTGEQLDISSLVVVGLGLAGLLQLVRGNVAAPAWYTAFWYALNIFLKAQPDGQVSDGGDSGE
jgi:hypothetical protein